MEQVWKCGFCCKVDVDADVIAAHEPKCSWNIANKTCHTCEHSWDSGYDYSIPECDIFYSTVDGQDVGNCAGWEEMK